MRVASGSSALVAYAKAGYLRALLMAQPREELEEGPSDWGGEIEVS